MASNSQIMNPTHTFNCFGISPFAMEANFRSCFFHPNIICASDPERAEKPCKNGVRSKNLAQIGKLLNVKITSHILKNSTFISFFFRPTTYVKTCAKSSMNMPNHHNNKFNISSKTVAPTKKIAVLDSHGKMTNY